MKTTIQGSFKSKAEANEKAKWLRGNVKFKRVRVMQHDGKVNKKDKLYYVVCYY